MGSEMSNEVKEDFSDIVVHTPLPEPGPSNRHTVVQVQFPVIHEDPQLSMIRNKIFEAEKSENYDECLELLRSLPHNRTTLLMRARFLVMKEEYLAANSVLGAVFKESPTNAEAITLLGLIFYYQGNFLMAVEVFKNALEINPDLKLAKVTKEHAGRLFRILRALPGEDAKDCEFSSFIMMMIETGLKIDPKNKFAKKKLQLHMTRTNFKMREYTKAIDNATEALKIDEENPLLFMYRARSYFQMKIYDDVIIDLMEVEKFNECLKIKREITQMRKLVGQHYIPRTHYDFLTVQSSSTEDEIRQTFNNMSLLHQVNLAKAATEFERRKLEFKFHRVKAAHAVLSNSQLRKKYDTGLEKEAAKIENGRRRQQRRKEVFDLCCGPLGRCFGQCYSCMCQCTSDEEEQMGLISGRRRSSRCISECCMTFMFLLIVSTVIGIIALLCWAIVDYSYWALLPVIVTIVWGCKTCRSTNVIS